MDAPGYVFAGGGTGGHLYPGLAVAAALRERDRDASITFFTTQRALDRDLLAGTSYAQVEQPVHPFTVHPLKIPGFLWAWRRSVAAAKAFLRANRTQAVLGLGGYAAGPPMVAAHALGIRTALLNPDAIPGRANRHLARHTDLVVLQWEMSRQHFGAGTRCDVLGCPIRAQFAQPDPAEGRRQFGLDADRPVLLVTGASQGARTVNRVMMRVWPTFHAAHPAWQLLHLSGPADEAEVRGAYAAAGCPAQVLSFTHDMPLALAAADLVVARAGASTLAELTALGKPAVLFPYPYHRDRHQHANAGVLVAAGCAIMLEDLIDPGANEGPLRAALEQVEGEAQRRKMGAAAEQLGSIRAADDVARWLCER